MPEAGVCVPVTVQEAERLVPSVVEAVITAVPTAMTFTKPPASTVATLALLLVHVIA